MEIRIKNSRSFHNKSFSITSTNLVFYCITKELIDGMFTLTQNRHKIISKLNLS